MCSSDLDSTMMTICVFIWKLNPDFSKTLDTEPTGSSAFGVLDFQSLNSSFKGKWVKKTSISHWPMFSEHILPGANDAQRNNILS